MAETIPGGAYQNPDGSWQDANGKPLPARVVRQLEDLTSAPTSEEELQADETAGQLEEAPVTVVTPPPPPLPPLPEQRQPGEIGADTEEVEAPKRGRTRRS